MSHCASSGAWKGIISVFTTLKRLVRSKESQPLFVHKRFPIRFPINVCSTPRAHSPSGSYWSGVVAKSSVTMVPMKRWPPGRLYSLNLAAAELISSREKWNREKTAKTASYWPSLGADSNMLTSSNLPCGTCLRLISTITLEKSIP